MTSSASLAADDKLVIAHRGASGYLAEHTLEAKELAFAQQADYLEQDIVMSADDALLVFHDLTLERMTDVAERFPARARADGSYYVIDFTLAELRQLQVAGQFRMHTLDEELALIGRLQQATGRQAGIYPELKSPWFHHQHGKDLARAVLTVLRDFGYTGKDNPVFVQSFDYHELQRVHDQLLPELGMELKLVQLIADNEWQETFELTADGSWQPYDYTWMHTPAGLQELAATVDGIGPAYNMLVADDSSPGAPRISSLTQDAQALGLLVHPYTFRSQPERLPGYVASFDEMLELFLDRVGVDGVFTDFPDKVVQFLQQTR